MSSGISARRGGFPPAFDLRCGDRATVVMRICDCPFPGKRRAGGRAPDLGRYCSDVTLASGTVEPVTRDIGIADVFG
jgi:hypothetical protein